MQLHVVPAAEPVVSRRIDRDAPMLGRGLRDKAARERFVAICAEYGLALAMIEVVPGPALLDPLGRVVMRGRLHNGMRGVTVEVSIGAWSYRESLLTIRPVVAARRLGALDNRYYERAHALAEHCVAYLTVMGSRPTHPTSPTPATPALIPA